MTGANAKANYSATAGAIADLIDIGASGGNGSGVNYCNATPNLKSVYQTGAAAIAANAGFGIEWFIYKKSKDQLGALDRVSWDKWFFQIRDGRPEFGELSDAWNQTESSELTRLWALASPTVAEQTRTSVLIKKLYVSLESLSFENSTGRDVWAESTFKVSFIPEPRGFIHIVLEGGGDAFSYECTRITKTRAAGVLWGASALTVGTTGGASFWRFVRPKFAQSGTIEYGPFRGASDAERFKNLTSRISADTSGGTVNFEPIAKTITLPGDSTYNGIIIPGPSEIFTDDSIFSFRLTLSGDGTATPWVYGASARTPNGAFVRGEDVTFDTAALYVPAGDGPRETGNPILDVNTVTERNGERHGSIVLRDVNGLTFAGVGGPINPGVFALANRRATLNIEGRNATGIAIENGPHFTDAILSGVRYTDLKKFAFTPSGGGETRQGAADIAKGETQATVEWCDGHYLLRQMKCEPVLINDLVRLGYAIDAVLKTSGQTLTAGHNLGPIVDGPALGEAWVSVTDENANGEDVINGLLDRYGLGLRLFQDRFGAWRIEPISSEILAAFVSTGSVSDPDLLRGGSRYILKDPLDVWIDTSDFYNSFKLVWGESGREQTIVRRTEESIYQPGFLNYLGYEKKMDTVYAPDIRTPAAAEYAMRSLQFRYSRFTRFGQASTFYHRFLAPYQAVTVDALRCEIQDIGGTSTARDEMTFTWGQSP